MLLLHVLQCARIGGWLVIQGWNANTAMPSQSVSKFWRGWHSGVSYPHCPWVTVFSIFFCISVLKKNCVNTGILCKITVKGALALCFFETHFASWVLLLYSLVSLSRPCSAILFLRELQKYPCSSASFLGYLKPLSSEKKVTQDLCMAQWGTGQDQTSCSGRSTQAQVNITHI